MADDQVVRTLAFEYLTRLLGGGTRPVGWEALSWFQVEGVRVPLVSQPGIFKPKVLDLPISIRTTYRPPGAPRPYEDELDDNGFLRYRYRGTDPQHRDNVLLRKAMEQGVPLIYLEGVAKGLYLPHGAAIIEDHPTELTFGVQLLPVDATAAGMTNVTILDPTTRRYYMRLVKQRTTQAAFREQVLAAYRNRCTFCWLGHRELLDAAHIIPDADGGKPVVTNGMSMCKIHHAAYDANIVGVRPDYVAEVREDILHEADGPMLRHGLQQLHGAKIHVPRPEDKRPSPEALERRYEEFRAAG